MRITIHGRRYRLKEKYAIKLQGLMLVALGFICHAAGSDEAMIFMGLCGSIMLFGRSDT